jgi:hypothetical protein
MTLVNRPAFQQAAGRLVHADGLSGVLLKGLKKDLKAQMKDIKRERRGLKREERDRRREIERSMRDGRRYGERRSTRWEGTEERDWDRDSLPRPGTEGQVTGTTATRDATHAESGKA